MPAPVPLPVGFQLYSRVTCPGCGGFVNFYAATEEQRGKLERYMYCPRSECEQHGIIYMTQLTVDGLVITGEKV